MRTGGFTLASYQGWACSLRLARSATLHVSKSKTSERRTPSQFDQNHCNSQKTNEAMPLSIKAMAARPKTMETTVDIYKSPKQKQTHNGDSRYIDLAVETGHNFVAFLL